MTLTPSRRAFICALSISALGILALASAALAQPAETPAKSLPELLGPWFGLFAVVISVGGTLYAFLSSPSKKNADAVETLNEIVTDQGKRIQTVEDELKHLPDRDSQHRVELALAQMNGRFEALDERLKPIAATSQRLSEFLLEQARKS
ncbi:DUF2730 family protein [Oricola sp.]|uniref:DUF2730 family protein n=1 Tax=Oricola sp. TaxID=1979950 RepID=UPI0025D514CB|nr:DUF2730 family protein [Oricola sp.]MCI5075565.1 DUF2730 domain-containing protein [Oricola sp.]